MVRTVQTFTYTYQSDVPNVPIIVAQPTTYSSGVLHGTRSPSNLSEEGTVFAWINDAPSLATAANHLTKQGYSPDSLVFIPFSTKENWERQYPHAKIKLDCINKKIKILVKASAAAASAAADEKPKKKIRKKRKKRRTEDVGLESIAGSGLTNPQRDLLHIEIYRYLAGLQQMLQKLEEEKLRKGKVCAKSERIGELMEAFHGTFERVIDSNFNMEEEKDIYASSVLEQNISDELDERLDKMVLKGGSHSREAGLTFEECFERLLAYKEEHGHVNVPIRHKDKGLANWVHDMRRNKKDLEKAARGEKPLRKPRSAIYVRPSLLTPERITLLESIGFTWGVRYVPKHISWEDRFKQLMEYYEANGSWPPHSLSGLGSWVKHQRRKYVIKEKTFMEKYYPKLEAVGFLWKVKYRASDVAGEEVKQEYNEQPNEPPNQHQQPNEPPNLPQQPNESPNLPQQPIEQPTQHQEPNEQPNPPPSLPIHDLSDFQMQPQYEEEVQPHYEEDKSHQDHDQMSSEEE